jgi:hypothetical protein
LRDNFVGTRRVFRRLRTHRRHAHVEVACVHVPARHIVNGVSFVGLGVVHVHAGHFAVVHRLRLLRLQAGLLGLLPRRHGHMVAGNGGKQDTYQK